MEMDGWMDGMSKNIKIRDYILYAKNNYEGKRRKYKKDENNLGIYFSANVKYIFTF